MKIELLYFEGCPFWQNGLERLKKALILEDAALQVEMKLIEHDEAAKKEEFLGSPSFHFDGQDLWPEERD